MKLKYLSLLPLLTATTIFGGTTPAYGESNTLSQPSFFCQTNEDIFITAAKTRKGEMQPIFHWKSEALPTQVNLEQTCHEVSQKLNNYVSSQNNLSSLRFKSAYLDSMPTICATAKENECRAVLLALPPVEKPVETASLILDSILDPQLQKNKIATRDRGVQSFTYEVDIWSLLGF